MQADGRGDRGRGELEDPALRRLMRSIAAGPGETRAPVTSRFDLVDLRPWSTAAYEAIEIEPRTDEESAELLTRWAVHLASGLAGRLGGHALSVAVVGSYVTELLAGSTVGLEELELEESPRRRVTASRGAAGRPTRRRCG